MHACLPVLTICAPIMESDEDILLENELHKVAWTQSRMKNERFTFKKPTSILEPGAYVDPHSHLITGARHSSCIFFTPYSLSTAVQFTFKKRPSGYRHTHSEIEVVRPLTTMNNNAVVDAVEDAVEDPVEYEAVDVDEDGDDTGAPEAVIDVYGADGDIIYSYNVGEGTASTDDEDTLPDIAPVESEDIIDLTHDDDSDDSETRFWQWN